ncbi:sphingomyelin synthase [Gurleya vavrai]
MNTMANISSFWSLDKDDHPPLPDVFFEFFQKENLKDIIDLMMNALIFFTFIFILMRRDAIQIYVRLFICISICYFCRMSTVALTNLPTPNLNCNKIVKNMFTTFNYNRCGDVMFSGHALIITLCAFVWSSYDLLILEKLSHYAALFIWITTFIIYVFIILARNHYSIDVLLSIYVTGSVWIIYGYIWRKYLCKESFCKDIIIDND